jgi:hypothetical protein
MNRRSLVLSKGWTMKAIPLSLLVIAIMSFAVAAQTKAAPKTENLVGRPAAPEEASAPQFFVIQDAKTARCAVVTARPTGSSAFIVGNGPHKTRNEALRAMKAVQICSTE